jgi:dolichyl-phosphate beta-glucosyltransferase
VSEIISLTVVIPAFNEAGRLPATLAATTQFFAGRPDLQPAEIIVVDDGSADATAAVAETFPAPAGVALRVVRLARNSGKGAAVRAGMAVSLGAHVLVCDADMAAPIEEVEKLLASGAGVAVGSRAVDRSLIARRQPWLRDHLGRLYNVALRGLGLTALHDTQCGFKLLDGELARRLAGELRIDGFAFDIELLARARRHGATIIEVPVRWSHVDDSRVRALRHGLLMLLDAVRVRIWMWRRRS